MEEEDALMGTDHDEANAKRIGRSPDAVTGRQVKRKIPAFSGWPGGGPGWKPEEIALFGTAPDSKVGARIGRSTSAAAQN